MPVLLGRLSAVLTLLLGLIHAASAFAEEYIVALPAIDAPSVGALDGTNRLRKTDEGFFILTEIPIRELDLTAPEFYPGGQKPFIIEYQIGTLDSEPVFIRVDVSEADYRGLSPALLNDEELARDLASLLESAAQATGMRQLKCENGRRCVKTCVLGGRTVCCKYECR